MKHVVVTAPFPAPLMEKIRAVSPQIQVEQVRLNNYGWPENKTTPAEIIYALGDLPSLEQAPNLRWAQLHYAGVNNLVDTPLWNSDIILTNASGVHAPAMAQYAMTQILAWAHRVPNWFKYQQVGTWPTERWEKFVPMELNGRSLGILGYGSIGRELARLAKGFGMKILVTKRDARRTEDSGYVIPGTGDPQGSLPDRIYPTEATRSMLAECDFVVVTLPHTPRTQHLIDESVLREMKPTAFLVNIGRGAIVNEDDLVKALKKGWIAGAGLDVFEQEPLPDSSPLWQLPNVILTPHVSGFTPAYDERNVELFTQNLRRYLAGEPLLNVVNRELGY